MRSNRSTKEHQLDTKLAQKSNRGDRTRLRIRSAKLSKVTLWGAIIIITHYTIIYISIHIYYYISSNNTLV